MVEQKQVYHVEPLRSTEEIEEMKLAIKRGNKNTPKRQELAERDVLIFLIGINTGLRVNDLVMLKIEDVKGKNAFTIFEGKANKSREVNIRMLQNEINHFIDKKHPEDYLFSSQKGSRPITTTQVYRILNSAAHYLGRKDIGTDTLRKTFGYHHYMQFKNMTILQEIFNHSAPSITERYIGIQRDEIKESFESFRLG